MKKYTFALFIFCAIALTGCLNNDFMERYPLGNPTGETAFVTYDNFKAYAWGLYETLPTLGYGDTSTDDISYNQTRGSSESNWVRGPATVPGKRNGTAWNYYGFIHRVNLMLGRIDASQMTEVEKAHWKSIGYFLHSYRYFSLLFAYGGVPWIDRVLSDNGTELTSGPRASRDEIAKHILEGLQYAEQHINVNDDGENTINKTIVQAFISRFCIFEGTWRRYHELNDADIYLKECKRVSAEVMKSYPEIRNNYDDLFCSLDLKDIPGVILYREFSNAENIMHAVSIGGTTGASYYNPTRDSADSYLCSDGKTRQNSLLFQGDKDMYNEFSCRGHRLRLQVTPPFRVDRSVSTDAWGNKWKFTDVAKDRSFIDSSDIRLGIGYGSGKERQKTLPFRQGYDGGILGAVPHFDFCLENQPWCKSAFGYNNWKYYYTYLSMGSQRDEETDMPLFRVEEVMLNYVEAICELGEFGQSVADQTVNKLRNHASVASMKVAKINAGFDPKCDLRDPSYPGDYVVDPLLWEVRREWRIELLSEGFRFDDLRRWKKCHYALKEKLGVYVKASDFPAGTKVTIDGGGAEGYLEFHPVQTHTWPEYYYLNPIPRNERVLNPQFAQNSGWDDGVEQPLSD